MSYRIMDKDYNFSHQFYIKFIHNIVRKGAEISANGAMKNYYTISIKSLRIILTDKCKRRVCNHHQIN